MIEGIIQKEIRKYRFQIRKNHSQLWVIDADKVQNDIIEEIKKKYYDNVETNLTLVELIGDVKN